MSAIINNSFRTFNANNFIDSVAIDRNSVYLAIGKSDPWSGPSEGEYDATTPSDVNPPAPPLDTSIATSKHWDDFIALKRINSSSVSHVIKRINWTSGTVYDAYDDKQDDLIDKDFFVFDPDTFNVYKCLDNNGGATSTVKPTGQLTTPNLRSSDGYVWKFMFEVKQPDVLKYVTSDWIPVAKTPASATTHPEQKSVEDAAIDGKLEHIKITNGGSAYISDTGTVAGVPSANQITLDANASAVDDIYNDMDVFITSGTGNGQLRRITDYDGSTKLATLSSDWTTNPDTNSGYSVAPAVVVTSVGTNNGSGATFRVRTVTAGVITDVVQVDGGTGYRQATASIVTAANGVNATLVPVISPIGGHGSNAVKELGGAFVMMNTRLTGTEGSDFPVNDDFRKVHVVVNPKLIGTNTTATENTYRQVSNPELEKNTGEIIYTEFRVPINRSADSTEDIKLVVEF